MEDQRHPLILILDSNQNSGFIMEKRLKSFGFDSDLFANPESIIEYLKNPLRTPDLILIDLVHPSPQILDLPHLVQTETKWGKTLPLVVYTSISDKSMIFESVQKGYVDYLIRPIEAEVFKERLQRLIEMPPIADETFQKIINSNATVQLDMHIIGVSELELTAHSSVKIPRGTILTLKSQVFEDMDIGSLKVRVQSCDEEVNKDFLYSITLSYIGLTASQLRDIRHYLMFSKTPIKEAS